MHHLESVGMMQEREKTGPDQQFSVDMPMKNKSSPFHTRLIIKQLLMVCKTFPLPSLKMYIGLWDFGEV